MFCFHGPKWLSKWGNFDIWEFRWSPYIQKVSRYLLNQWVKVATMSVNFLHVVAGANCQLQLEYRNLHFGLSLFPVYECFQKLWYPQIIHFNRVFHYFHHPFWGFYPTIFGNIHIGIPDPKNVKKSRLWLESWEGGLHPTYPESRSTHESSCFTGSEWRYMGVSKNRGGVPPKWMVKIMENPIKIDDLGVP